MRLLSSLRSNSKSRSNSPAPSPASSAVPPSPASPAPVPATRLRTSARPATAPASTSASASGTQNGASASASDASQWISKLHDVKARGQQATKLELAGDMDAALQAYFDAGQSYLWLIAHYPKSSLLPPSVPTSAKLKTQLGLLLKRGESIKAARPKVRVPTRDMLSAESQARVVRMSGVVQGHVVSPWNNGGEGTAKDIALLGCPPLSEQQKEVGASFCPALSVPGRTVYDSTTLTPDALVQDRVADCSTVASLQAMVLHDRRWGSELVRNRIYPHDSSHTPSSSPTRTYAVKLFLNGVERCAYVNDDLPHARLPESSSNDASLVCARTRDDRQIWPGLIEKAYLSLIGRGGGYSFAGSDPGQDLRALSGWVPEHIDLSQGVSVADRTRFRPERAWHRIFSAFSRPGCLLTAGTPASGESRARGEEEAFVISGGLLVTSHAYSVVDMYVTPENERRITLLNPWSVSRMRELYRLYLPEADVLAQDLERATLDDSSPAVDPRTEQYLARTMDLSWIEFCTRMGSIFLNVDPNLWQQRTTVHAHWDKPYAIATEPTKRFATTQQFILTLQPGHTSAPDTDTGEEQDVWVLLERHHSRSAQAPTVHVSLKLVETTATDSEEESQEEAYQRLVQARDTRQRVYWIDAPECLHKIHLDRSDRGRTRTFLITASCVPGRSTTHGDPNDATSQAHDGIEEEEQRFTLTILSPLPTQLSAAGLDMPYRVVVPGQWQGKSAGGSSLNPSFLHNPQWSLVFTPPESYDLNQGADVRVALHCAQSDALVAAHLVRSNGRRISSLSAPTGESKVVVVGSTGPYDSGLVSFSARSLPLGAGGYTLVVSTYDPGVQASFNVQLESTVPLTPKFLPPEGSGLYARTANGVWLAPGASTGIGSVAAQNDAGPEAVQVHGWAVGSPSRSKGQYHHNPSVRLVLPTGASQLSARLVPYATPDSHGARPFTNVTLFTPSANQLGSAVATSGAYTDSLAGSYLPPASIQAGEHRLVLSTYAPWAGAFALHVYAGRAFQLEPV